MKIEFCFEQGVDAGEDGAGCREISRDASGDPGQLPRGHEGQDLAAHPWGRTIRVSVEAWRTAAHAPAATSLKLPQGQKREITDALVERLI
ncbi:hypothetical protein FEF34_22045 [Streptomyces marianii]|uniref:Uncharacterized protein n=1 Tax=Streptomyces marianii TaxID=1817406 RepID=A0A5R9EAY5_9ACTN|nr:hypothetical protein FEF34_22045 [Streptomyces marianii]